MTTEQAQQRLEEIRRLLMQREKAAKVVQDIDTQIASLAGAAVKLQPPQNQHLSKNDFLSIAIRSAQ